MQPLLTNQEDSLILKHIIHFYTIVVYSTGAIQPWSTKQYILGMCMASLSFLLAVRLPAHCQIPRGIHVVGPMGYLLGAPIGGTFQSPQNWENATVTWLWHLRSGTSVAQLAIRRLERLLSRTWWNWGIATPKKKNVIEHIEHWVWLHFSIFCVFLGFTM